MDLTFKQTVDEIVARHHSLLRRELPEITELIDMLAASEPDCDLSEACEISKRVRKKIEAHLKDEETVLFPTGIALESGAPSPPSDLDIMERLKEMEREHDGCGNALATVSTLVAAVPQSELRDKVLESIGVVLEDLVVHVERENSFVHPKLVELLNSAHTRSAH